MEGSTVMSIVVRFNPIGLTTERYNESIKLLKEAGAWPPAGLDYHVFFGPEGDMRVSEIWDSPEKLDAFGQVLMPILASQGQEFSSDPDVFEIHDTFKR
jgi:hypothetical protein